MPTIRAIYENGVFRPLEPIELPDGCHVELHNLRLVGSDLPQDLDSIYEFPDHRRTTGEQDLAERHNEHEA